MQWPLCCYRRRYCARGRLELHPGASRWQWPFWCYGRRYVYVDASSSTPGPRGGSRHHGATDASCVRGRLELHPGVSRRQWPPWCYGRRYVNVDASSFPPEPRGGSGHSGVLDAAMSTWTPRGPPRSLEEAVAIMVHRTPLCERGRLELHPRASRRQLPLWCYGRRYVNVDASSSAPGPRGGWGHYGATDDRYVNVDASSSTPEPRGGRGQYGATGAAL